jgi:hypothetical protein
MRPRQTPMSYVCFHTNLPLAALERRSVQLLTNLLLETFGLEGRIQTVRSYQDKLHMFV